MLLNRDLLKEFLFEIEIKNYTPRTIKTYRNNLNRFFDYLEKKYSIKDIEQIMPQHIKQYVRFLQQQGRKATYINNIIKNLRAYYKYCQGEQYVTNNIMQKVDWLKEEKVVIKTFEDDEVMKMLNAYNFTDYLNTRNKTILAFLFDLGIRNLELCNLINTDIRETVIRIMGKGRKERCVPISPMLNKFIIKYNRVKNFYFQNKIVKYDNYFLSHTGRPLTKEAVERVVKIAGERAGVRKEIRCSPHTCRHFYAQEELINGLDLYSLQRLLGHEKTDTTKRYLQGLQDKTIMQMSLKTSPLMNLKGGRK